MYYYLALWTSLLFSAINIDFVFAEPQLPEGIDMSSSSSDTLGDWSLDSDNPLGSYMDDFTIPSSFESASLLPTTSTLGSVETQFPQDDLFANDIVAADCSSEGIEPKSKFRTRQTCMQTPQILPQVLPEVTTPKKDVGSKDQSFPENLGLFESYDPLAYGEKDEDSCPPAIFGDKKYSVCDSGERGMLKIDQFGYANLQSCKPGA